MYKKLLPFFCVFFMQSSFASTTIIPEVNSRAKQAFTKSKEVRMQVTQVTRKEIAESPVVNLSELLAQEQSVVRLTNNSGDNSQTALSIRGFGDNAGVNTLILVDGFPLTNPSLLAPNFNSIPLADIERVDILQGSAGTLWGDQAVGGVVNIITRHPEKTIINLTGSAGTFTHNFFNGFAADKFQNGFYLKAFGLSSKNNNYRHHNQQTNANGNVVVGYDYARGTISFYVQTYNSTIEFPGGLTATQFAGNPRQATNFMNHVNYTTHVYQILSKHEIYQNWLLETRLAHKNINSDGFVYSASDINEWQNYINPRLLGTIYQNKIVLGYAYQNSRYQFASSMIKRSADAAQNNLYAQIIIPVFNKWDITLGSRYASQHNQVQKTGTITTTNATNQTVVTEQGLSYHPNETWQFFLRRDGNFRFPKANEETWLPAGKSLQMQTGVSYEAGVTRTTQTQTTQLSLYQLQLHNEIAFDPTSLPLQPIGTYRNFDKTTRQGVTITETYRVTPVLMLDGQINYVNARFASGTFSGNEIPAVPALNGNLGLKYQFAPRWQTQYYATYTGPRYASDNDANVNGKLPGYWLNSIALQYMLKPLMASLEVMNIFNQSYPAYTLYNPISKTNTYYPGAGRGYLLTIKVNID